MQYLMILSLSIKGWRAGTTEYKVSPGNLCSVTRTPECPKGFVSRNTCFSWIVIIRYSIWRPGKLAFWDAGLWVPEYTSLEVRKRYAQCQMAPLVILQALRSFLVKQNLAIARQLPIHSFSHVFFRSSSALFLATDIYSVSVIRSLKKMVRL